MSLRTYVSAERGRVAAVARRIGVLPVLVSQWASEKRDVPIEHCAPLEAATDGAVRRWQLRPQDWHRIWPELVNAPGAPSVPSTSLHLVPEQQHAAG